MTQTSMLLGTAHAGRLNWVDEITWARRAVDAIGHKNVAYELDVSPSALTDALIEREGEGRKRRLCGEWLTVILQLSSQGMRQEYMRMKCDALGFEPPLLRRVRTAEERLADLERALEQRLGDIGRQLIAENNGERR